MCVRSYATKDLVEVVVKPFLTRFHAIAEGRSYNLLCLVALSLRSVDSNASDLKHVAILR